MPYEVSMSGGAPWGFRIAGGPFAGKPTAISRITPGGKAAQANVMQGDILIAVNGFAISHLDLPELMEMIKVSGWTLHLTLISQEEIAHVTNRKRHSEANITNASDIERPRSQLASTPASLCSEVRTSRPASQQSCKKEEETTESPPTPVEMESDCVKLESLQIEEEICSRNGELISTSVTFESVSTPVTPVQEHPEPKPRRSKSADHAVNIEVKHENIEIEEKHVTLPSPTTETETKEVTDAPKKMPDFLRRQLKPQKPLPTLKPQVSWLHNKLKITPKRQNGLKDPGHSLKVAAAAYPGGKIEIDGPVSATIVHSQYNTPVGMYSANQIASTLVNTAAARGAKVPDPEVFGDQHVTVDKNTAVYKMVHKTDKPRSTPAQSRSIQILDALLEHGQEIPQSMM